MSGASASPVPSGALAPPTAAVAAAGSARPIPIARRSSSNAAAGPSGAMARSFSPAVGAASGVAVPLARSMTRGTPSEKTASRRRSSAAAYAGARRPSATGERATSVAATSALEDLSDDMFEPPKAGAGAGKKAEIYQCEKCRKFYKHPACLSKHRWQHTEYWSETSKYQLSKHQSVQMLEAAAILVHPSSLPQEKSLWPAAVSSPESGLLGSHELNRETLRRFEAQHIGSPPMAAFASLALGALAPPPPASSMPLKSEMAVDSDDALMDDDAGGDVDMFEFELNGLDTASTAPTTTLRSDGSGSGGEESHRAMWTVPRDFRQPPLVARPSYAASSSQQPAVAFGVSAPPLHFWQPRTLEPAVDEMRS